MKRIIKEKNISPSTLNFIGNLCGFLVTYSISFFLSPYIVGIMGESAYGFVALATTFTNYISLVTVALNSLASRFISIAIFNGKDKEAKKYYSSVMIANGIITTILLVPCTYFIINLEKYIVIPTNIIFDVKVLFAIIFLSFFISLLSSLFSVAVFTENKLYLTAIHNVEAGIIRAILTVLLFVFLPAKIFYVGIITLVVNGYTIAWQYYYKTKYLPDLKVKLVSFELEKVIKLIKSGIWSLVSQLSSLLNTGLDLLLANQFISSSSMGQLSIASTLPTLIQSILASVSSSFTPNLTKHYAQRDFGSLMKELDRSIRMMNLVLIVPLAGVTAFGESFYALWQPTQNSETLQILSVLKMLCLTFTAGMAAVHEIFIITNRLRPQAIATLISGISNIIVVYILLSFTDMGVYAIAGVSSVIAILRNFLFTFPYAARCVNQKWYAFYKMALRAYGVYLLICLLYGWIQYLVGKPSSWGTFVLLSGICGILGVILVFFLIIRKEERKNVLEKFKRRVKNSNSH